MKLLLTGGTGFIGSRVALEARRQQVDVVVTGLVKHEADELRAAELRRAGIALESGPLQEPEFARRIVDGRGAMSFASRREPVALRVHL